MTPSEDRNTAYCAHLHISWRVEENNGVCRGWWECDSNCGMKFAPAPDRRAAPASGTETTRCAWCGWPYAKSRNEGCVPGDCSQRPFPERLFDPERAKRESHAFALPDAPAAPTSEGQLLNWIHDIREIAAMKMQEAGTDSHRRGFKEIYKMCREATPPSPPSEGRSCLVCGYAPDEAKQEHMPGVWHEPTGVHVCIECRQRAQSVTSFGLTIDELRIAAKRYRAHLSSASAPLPAETPRRTND